MFRYEKDMIPVIKEFFLTRFKTSLYVEEFNSGIGVADLVFAQDISKRDFYFKSFELLFHTLMLFDRKNKILNDNDFISRFSIKQASSLIEKFMKLNLIVERGVESYLVKSYLSPSVNEFYAVEAKLKDWKNGLYQALRYKNFAQNSFLAISSEYIHRVDKAILIENNIGLISVSHNNTDIIINSRKKSPNDKVAFYFSGENFTKTLFLNQEIGVYSPHQWL